MASYSFDSSEESIGPYREKGVLVLFVIVAAVVGLVLGRWAFKHRDTIRVYRDHLERAAAETAPPESRSEPHGPADA
jgi:hypothetical protein